MIYGFNRDLCPVCGCNNAPMVFLDKDRGWICEDCYEKEVKEHGNTSDNNCNDMRDLGSSCIDKQ